MAYYPFLLGPIRLGPYLNHFLDFGFLDHLPHSRNLSVLSSRFEQRRPLPLSER